MPRESSKTRKWAKDRRDRLNESFSALAKVLPCYDPSITLCKIDILQKAALNIRELQEKVNKILSPNIESTENKTEREDVIKKLHDRVKKLLVRNEQLSNLLRDAGLPVPTACGTIKKFKRNLLWSKRITPQQAELLRKSELEKESLSAKVVQTKKKKYKNSSLNTSVAPKHRNVTVKKNETKSINTRKKLNGKKVPTSNCLIVLSQPATIRTNLSQPCYLIKNQAFTSPKVINKVGLKGSGPITNPIIVGTSKPSIPTTFSHTNPTLSSLGPGTLILANGTLVPILNQPQSLLPTQSISTKTVTYSGSNVIVLPTTISSIENNSKKIVANIKPLIKPKYCLTRTTQVNKVPIPALTSRYANNNILLNETKIPKMNAPSLKKIKPVVRQNKNLSKPVNQNLCKRKCEATVQHTVKKQKSGGDDKKALVINAEILNPSSTSVAIDDLKHTEIVTNIGNIETKNLDIKDMAPVKIKQGPNTDKSDTCSVNVNTENNFIPKLTQNDNISVPSNHDLITLSSTVATTKSLPEFEKTGKDFVCNSVIKKNKENGNENFEGLITTTSSNTAQSTATTTTANNDIKSLELNLSHSELSNDIFASLQVPPGCQNPESTSPTAAFLLAFPLVSSGIKVTEVIDEDNSESQRGTPNLLQIGTMDLTKPTQSQSNSLTSSFINLDNISFFSSKDVCDNFYSANSVNKPVKTALPSTTLNTSHKTDNVLNKAMYVNVKSPSLPKCAAKPIKDSGYEKPLNISKEVHPNIPNFEKRHIEPQTTNVIIDTQNTQSTTKCAKPNYMSSSKPVHQVSKNVDQKPQYQMPPYSNSACNFNCTDTSKIFPTCSYVNKTYSNPLYTNSNNYNYGYNYHSHSDNNFNQNYYKNIPKNENKAYYPLNYPEYHKTETSSFSGRYYSNTIAYSKDRKNINSVKVKTTNQSKVPINWMTTPDNRLQTSDCFLTPFSKNEFGQTYPFTSCATSSSTYFNTTSADNCEVNNILEAKKTIDLPMVPISSHPHQKTDIEEKQFSWSPTKLPHFLDPAPSFVSSTLPTLVGDLALGNPLPFAEQKCDYKYTKENKEIRRINKAVSYENQSSFLSVSQLVDHSKPDSVSSRLLAARNIGNKPKSNVPPKCKKIKKQENKDLSSCGINVDKGNHTRPVNNYGILESNELLTEQKKSIPHKNASSSYSAEALIGNQLPDDSTSKRYPSSSNKSIGVSSFLAENIISYFPPSDLAQENYLAQNQNYQISNFSHNLSTSSQNNTYPANNFIYTAPTITSSYLSTNNFESDNHEFNLPDNLGVLPNPTKDTKGYAHKNYTKQSNKDVRMNHNITYPNNLKRSRKMQTNDSINGLTGFDFPLFPMSGSTNSPLLPDDFHSHTGFLPPTTPYPCKNSLYPKQSNDICTLLPTSVPMSRSNIQHPEISPSINSVGTSLTNFNLSTIFPEINKGPITDIYSDVRPH